MKKIIVIGGGAAGAKAASKARRMNKDNYIELYTNEDIVAFSLCGLPYYIEGSVKDINSLIIRTPEKFIENGISVFINHEAQEIYPEKNSVLINDNHIFYDELILATGARVNIPDIKNIDINNVFTLRSLKSAQKIREKMLNSKSALIIGGGYISLELAQAFIKNNLKVTILESTQNLLNNLDLEFSKIMQEEVKRRGGENIEIILGEKADEFISEDNNFKSVLTQSGKKIEADFCVLCTGILPNCEIAKKSGIRIGSTGAIYVDNKMRTSIPNIYAAGDCAQKYCITTKKPIYIGLGTIANKEGRVAAINASSDDLYENFDGILASSITGFFDFTISKTGLSEKRAIELSNEINLEPVSATVTKKDKAGYMPNSNNMTIKITIDKRSGELLGAQGAGCGSSVAQRINTITSLLQTRSRVDDLLNIDLPYAPPYSGSIDPVITCAYKLKELLTK